MCCNSSRRQKTSCCFLTCRLTSVSFLHSVEIPVVWWLRARLRSFKGQTSLDDEIQHGQYCQLLYANFSLFFLERLKVRFSFLICEFYRKWDTRPSSLFHVPVPVFSLPESRRTAASELPCSRQRWRENMCFKSHPSHVYGEIFRGIVFIS